MNLCSHYSFLSSFYTCEDAAVRPWGHLAPIVAAVAGAAVVPDSVKWSHIFVL
jgi:hypothetical protein